MNNPVINLCLQGTILVGTGCVLCIAVAYTIKFIRKIFQEGSSE